ncbi:MAG: carbon storage regulator CsrA [Anaerolineae bacterium]
MLILTRRPGETVVIQGDIKVHVLAVEGDRVKLGVDAPRDVPIVRQELLDEVRRSNLEAAIRGDERRRLAASLGRLVQKSGE